MFCYQPNYFSQTEAVTSELFTRLVISDNVVCRIKQYRKALPELDRLKQEVKSRETLIAANPDPKLPANKELKEEIRRLKRQMQEISRWKTGLPVLMYQAASFDETTSLKGYRGRWRKQQAVRLNGLFMLDVDHVSEPRKLFGEWVAALCTRRCDIADLPDDRQRDAWADYYGILLVHITPSGRGLRIVATADAATGNIADNQAALAKRLGVEPDAACKDASRCSFCPGLEDILFINQEKLFNYENREYDQKFGPQYRGGSSQPTAAAGSPGGGTAHAAAHAPRVGAVTADAAAAAGARVDGGADGEAAKLDERLKEGYHGKSYADICAAWFRQNGGEPKAGDRHQSLYRLACDVRDIADFNPALLARILAECTVGADVAAERGQRELDRIAGDACALQHYRAIPRRLQAVLQSAGLQLPDGAADHGLKAGAEVDYAAWWTRLKPLLEQSPVLQEAVVTLPDHLKLMGVLAAGAMLGTYLSRTWWEHFDGKDYRLSFLVYIIGAAASGKSAVTELDRLIMAPMLASDRVGREWERQYKEDMKKRAASSKDAKAAAPDQQHPCIRYVPSTISNAMLYRRLTDATDPDTENPDGTTPLHLHIYTMEPELATALRAQQGSWAGKNDLELKSFHNEFAGVDYANDQSVNGIIQVNWNQVVTGTPESMGRKIKPSMVLDGLVTRLVLFPMPQNDFQMIDRRQACRDPEREAMLRSVGITLEQVKGELKADRLVDFCYDYEKKLTDEARLEQDLCLDYFRKRIPVIMMRYTLVRMVLRQQEAVRKGQPLEVRDDDLEFARLIGDWCLMAQMHFYGQMVIDAQERERSTFTPRKRSTKIREAYARLPRQLDRETLVAEGVSASVEAASVTLKRWLDDGLVVKEGKKYVKKFDEIPI